MFLYMYFAYSKIPEISLNRASCAHTPFYVCSVYPLLVASMIIGVDWGFIGSRAGRKGAVNVPLTSDFRHGRL